MQREERRDGESGGYGEIFFQPRCIYSQKLMIAIIT